MLNFVTVIQILSGLATGFLILAHEPKSEGLGSIGGSAHHFKGMQSSAEDKLDQLTWASFILFYISNFIKESLFLIFINFFNYFYIIGMKELRCSRLLMLLLSNFYL
jgi:protein translocase SecG subunit